MVRSVHIVQTIRTARSGSSRGLFLPRNACLLQLFTCEVCSRSSYNSCISIINLSRLSQFVHEPLPTCLSRGFATDRSSRISSRCNRSRSERSRSSRNSSDLNRSRALDQFVSPVISISHPERSRRSREIATDHASRALTQFAHLEGLQQIAHPERSHISRDCNRSRLPSARAHF